MRTPLLAGNWKMYKTIPEAIKLAVDLKKLVAEVEDREICICPPFTALDAISEVIKESNLKLGAQDLFFEKEGAYTGEISALMLKDVGCEYVIIGHSERRQYFHETDESVNKKILAALKVGLAPIVCVGETLEERDANQTCAVVEKQIRGAFRDLTKVQMKEMVIAYEPVWAIGTGRTATPAQAEEVQAFIRKLISEIFDPSLAEDLRILYGGSVKPENIKELMAEKDIDGALVGGASLDANSFAQIVKY